MTLLALQALGKNPRCAKVFQADGVVLSYSRITWWRPVRARVSSPEGLYRALVRLAERQDLIVVRGELLDPTATRILRRVHGDKAALRDADRWWACVDLDNVVTPLGMDVTAASAVAYLRTLLPPWLAQAGLVLQWSQTAGRDAWAKLKAHLWFWFDRPVCSGSLHRWALQHRKLIDAAMMLPVQPHYTSDPIIEDGWTGRPSPSVVLFPGAPAEVPIEILCLADEAERAEREKRERAEHARQVVLANRYTAPGALESQARLSMTRLGRSQARKILAAGEGNRHRAVMRAAAAVVALAGELGVSHHAAMREVAEAGRAVLPASRGHEVDEMIKAVGG